MESKDNISKEEHLKDSTPNLSAINKENTFYVPENYFENLSDAISNKCVEKKKANSIHILYPVFQKALIPLAITVSVILIFLFSQKKNDSQIINTNQYAYIDNNGTSDYLNNLIDNNDLDESLIVSELINDDTIKSTSKIDHPFEKYNAFNENPVIVNDTITNTSITEDDIIQYLLDDDESDDLLN